jgi:periplasmic protein CpxP/Spy
MRGTRKRAGTTWALAAMGVLTLFAASAILLVGSAVGRNLPTDLLARAAAAPANTGQGGQSSATTSTQSLRAPIQEVESRIADLHRRLLITPPQEPQFKAYADVMRANAQTIQSLFDERAKKTDISAVGMLRWVARLTRAHADNLDKLVPVFEALYQTLSDQQKKAADTAFEEIRQRRPAQRAQ